MGLISDSKQASRAHFLTTAQPGDVDSHTARIKMRDAVHACMNCSYCFNGNGPVLPSGPTPNHVMVIGDFPTRTDDRQGQLAFRDDAEVLLRSSLLRGHIDLDSLFHANTIQCWAGYSKTVPDRVIRACVPNLKTMLAVCQPRVILTLGSMALRVSTDKVGRTVTKDHGRPFLSRAGPFMGRWVFPTWHPASIKHGFSTVAETRFRQDIADFCRWYAEGGWL